MSRFEQKFRDNLLLTKPDLEKVHDEHLSEFGLTKMLIEKWRLKLPYTKAYTENSWQFTLYKLKLGKYVAGFEQCDVGEIEDILEMDVQGMQEDLDIKKTAAKNLLKKLKQYGK
eukprot:UN17970